MDVIKEFFSSFTELLGGVIPGNVVGALIILIVGYILAKFLKGVFKKLFSSLDERFGKEHKISEILSKLLYYILMLYLLIIVLDLIGVQNVFDPIKGMLGEFLSFIPNIVAAGIIGYAGYMIATLVSSSVMLLAGKIESWTESKGFKNSINIAKLLKQIVFVFIFIPMLIVALETLNMSVISVPATKMLGTFMDSIPKIIAATIIIAVFYVGAKLLTSILKEFLNNIGINNYAEKVGIGSVLGGEKTELSTIITSVIFFFIMFAGIISGLEKLELFKLTVLLNDLMILSGQIIFGLIIMVFGNFIANIASNSIKKSESKGLSSIVKFAILGLFLAMSLRTMGIANEIVDLAFGLILGAIAVAVALSFGLGGREAAGEQMKKIIQKFNEK